MYLLYHTSFDGMAKPIDEYSIMAYGYSITINVGKTERTILEESGVIKWKDSANSQISEYMAFIAALNGLTAITNKKPKHVITISGDCQTIIYQMQKIFQVRSDSIRPFFKKSSQLLDELTHHHEVLLRWKPRAQNKISHNLAHKAYDHWQSGHGQLDFLMDPQEINSSKIPLPPVTTLPMSFSHTVQTGAH